jgi:hypothetical protein
VTDIPLQLVNPHLVKGKRSHKESVVWTAEETP